MTSRQSNQTMRPTIVVSIVTVVVIIMVALIGNALLTIVLTLL